MKKLILLTVFISVSFFGYSQKTKGNWLVEMGITPYVTSGDNSVEIEGGYLIANNSAIKFGFGYLNSSQLSYLVYKAGFKHYFSERIPLQIDVTGSASDGDDSSSFLLGLQGGYAAFLTEKISLEPNLRYRQPIEGNSDGLLELRFNFVFFF